MNSQSAIEFMVSYSWAFLILALIIAIILVTVGSNPAMQILPPTCIFSGSLNCIDIVMHTNSTATLMEVSVSNPQVGIVNFSRFSATFFSENAIGSCSPGRIYSGENTVCRAIIYPPIPISDSYIGTLVFYANFCSPVISEGSNTPCPSGSEYSYVAHIVAQNIQVPR